MTGLAPMSATSYPHQIQKNLESAKAVITVLVRGEKDDTPWKNTADAVTESLELRHVLCVAIRFETGRSILWTDRIAIVTLSYGL